MPGLERSLKKISLMRKIYKVGTFYHKEDKLCLSKIMAYIRWYSPSWEGCIVFDVEANSTGEAKKKAILKRLEYEKKIR